MTESVTTTNDALAIPAPVCDAIQTLDAAAAALLAPTSDSVFGTAIGAAVAMGTIEAALTDELMQTYIMPLAGKSTGYKTDKDRKGGYDVATTRTAVIGHVAKGGKLVGNELNIIASNDYQTKAFFFRRLDEALGAGNWQLNHDVPRIASDKRGALVNTTVRWKPGAGDWQEQRLEHAVKGDQYATADTYLGKADRKCAAWLYQRVTGMVPTEGDADDSITVQATVVHDAVGDALTQEPVATKTGADEPSKPTTRRRRKAAVTEASAQEFAQAMKAMALEIDIGDVTAYLQEVGWLSEGDDMLDLTDQRKAEIVAGRDDLVAATKAWKSK